METENSLLDRRTAGNENTGLIKLIAVFFMVIDHVGAAFFPKYVDMRILGRIGMPLFCWGIVVGTVYTRNIWKYFLRILIVGAISQPCFMLGLNHDWSTLNVFPTLGLGVLAIAGIRWKKYGSHIWMPVLSIFVSMWIKMDYGWTGVALILVLYACRNSKSALAASFTAFCMFWGLYYGYQSQRLIFGLKYGALTVPWMKDSAGVFKFYFCTEFWAILALPVMLIPMKRRFKVPKWIGYSIYPLHLLVIGVIRHWGEISAAVTAWLGTGTTPPV